MIRSIKDARDKGYALDPSLIHLYARSGSLKVRDLIFYFIRRHSSIFSALDKEFRLRFMVDFIRDTFDNPSYWLDENVRAFLFELDNYDVQDPLRQDLLQSLLGVIDSFITDESIARHVESTVADILLRTHPEMLRTKVFSYSDEMAGIFKSAQRYIKPH